MGNKNLKNIEFENLKNTLFQKVRNYSVMCLQQLFSFNVCKTD